MADHDVHDGATSLNDRLWDLLVYVPVGIAVSVVDELPTLAARGRQRVGVRVSSARAVGQFVVKTGHDELRRRSDGLRRRPGPVAPGAPASGPRPPDPAPSEARSLHVEPRRPTSPSTDARQGGNGHVPEVSSLSIPAFDTLSASQVVQRLDGLSRSELVSVRAYEASNRGRRTILNRVDQLLDERS